ncbi:MAG: polysaccharide deacetylase family protein [Bacteroidota bacterium]|nr:polysaccharide deacetylase family protein [Bacteroidota bacterium]MDP4204664.1 polysaccharide deacetylase family protein [Bacteroidota bacterium]
MKLQVHLPSWITNWFPAAVWKIPTENKEVYLTFDDGPIPEVTPRVLQLLREENVPATFFCVGENVSKHPEVFGQILDDGHMTGNHTYNHLQGLKTSKKEYYNNVEKANRLIGSNLFRPPHGWLRRAQYKKLSKKYKIIMWDAISCDYNPAVSPKECLRNVLDYVRPGSIITFHDSIKAEKNLFETLPKVIRMLKEQGYTFRKIEFENVRNLYTDTHFGKLVRFKDVMLEKWA